MLPKLFTNNSFYENVLNIDKTIQLKKTNELSPIVMVDQKN